jgi:hypothetical protein
VLLSVLMVLALPSCSSVTIKDHEFCADIGTQGATCVHMFTDESRDIPPGQWDDVRFGMICASGDAIADLKAALEKLCSLTNSCSYETQKKIKDFFSKIDRIEDRSHVHR